MNHYIMYNHPMQITFIPLAESHFPLLLQWLKTPHVKAWWDSDTQWTLGSIQEKYTSYVKGYKLDNGVSKPIKACIICVAAKPIGYIQIYNPYDFPDLLHGRSGLPKNLGAFDIFIGDKEYLGQSIGLTIPAGIIHQVFNKSNTSVHFLVVSCPDSHGDRVNIENE